MESIIRKIQKALSLAHNNSNANEAQNAMLLAQRMMAQHNLTVSDLPQQQEQKKAERSKINMFRIEWWQRQLSSIIADNFRCYAFMARGSYVGFLGLEQDSQIATEIFKYAVESIKHHAAVYLRANKGSRSRAYALALKNDYISGFLIGMKAKFAEQVEKESLALVLVKDDIVVRTYEDWKLKEGRPIKKSTAQNQDAIEQGYMDGREFEKPVAQLQV